MPKKILLDTDIGSDIDDAVCLAYLLAEPEADLLGITTVTGEGLQRAQMSSVLCRIVDRDDIPIYPGAELPLLVEARQPKAPQSSALARWSHRADGYPTGEAIEFLRQTIRANPGEITLLAIGPLTNIALLFAVDPEIPALLDSLVLMSGCFTRSFAEWNVINDPHASAMVYRTPNLRIKAIGLDVTTQVKMAADDVRARFNTPLLRPVLDFAEVWFEKQPVITFHDPLAAVTIFDDKVCRFEQGEISVNLGLESDLGRTHWAPGEGQHDAALDVQPGRFFDTFFNVFSD